MMHSQQNIKFWFLQFISPGTLNVIVDRGRRLFSYSVPLQSSLVFKKKHPRPLTSFGFPLQTAH